MKVLIGCEYSGTVRDAFTAAGYYAQSVDLLPSETPGHHFQGDLLEFLKAHAREFDLFICHPPCTYLAYSGKAYWDQPGRYRKRLEALKFFLDCWDAPIAMKCFENPIGCIDPIFRKPDQIIHPYYFGDPEMKRTCLWLENLPLLRYKMSDDLFGAGTAVDKPEPVYVDENGKNRYRTDSIAGKSKNGQSERARFFPSVARAMAEQWGTLQTTTR